MCEAQMCVILFMSAAYAKQLDTSISKRIDALTKLQGNSHGCWLLLCTVRSVHVVQICSVFTVRITRWWSLTTSQKL